MPPAAATSGNMPLIGVPGGLRTIPGDAAIRSALCDGMTGSASPVETFRPPRARVSVERILHRQGYRDLDQVRPAIRRMAEHAARLSEQLHDPQARYRRLAIGSCRADGRLGLRNGTVLHCEAFPRSLGWCSEAVLFVITAGCRIDEEIVENLAGGERLLEAMLLETAGWLALDDSTRHFKRHIATEAARGGRRLGRRMGPGHSYRLERGDCTWPLEDQEALFSAFGGHALPVELLPSRVMLPKLSRSGLFGEGVVARQRRTAHWPMAAHRTYSDEGETS